ncbi:hydroxyacid-oxoacid transhydrogenase [Salinifilum aidingensis]
MSERTSETVFTWAAPPLKFGAGAVGELGFECEQLGLGSVLIVTDRAVAATGAADRARDAVRAAGIRAEVYEGARSEPTDASIRRTVDDVRGGDWDGVVAVGGGSVIDTAKAVALLSTHPGDPLEYVNQPIGEGKAPPGPVKPVVAVPTTAGTGAESTAVCILDLLDLQVKSGISHARLRPVKAVVDPELSLPLPPHVTACAGMDVLCHALESYTARPHHAYPRRSAAERPTYVGANPVSDAFVEKALPLVARSLRPAVMRGHDEQARTDMMLAASFAGMGFGNAGVHVPHACAYPIAGRVTDFHPPDYSAEEPMVPHGESVALTAPAAFRLTFPAAPERHVHAAELLDPAVADIADRAERLPAALVSLMRDIGIANGVSAVGYGREDVPALVDGALKQQRLLTMCPRDVGAADLRTVVEDSLVNW